jgi:hypothetical protein
MSSSSKTKPKATSGTASAIVKDDEDFKSFEGIRFIFFLDEKTNRWHILATSGENQLGQYQYISLWLPNEGDIVKKTYVIVDDHDAPGKANASWTKATSSTFKPYPAISGSVTVTLNSKLQTVELTFDFKGESGQEKVSLTQGDMKLQGLTEEKKARASGSIVCDLSESINERYESTETAFDKKGETGSFPAYLHAWSQQLSSKPEFKHYQISINIANGLLPGTYTFSPASKQVRIFFTDMLDGLSWLADSGTITFKSIPNFESITGKLSGQFNFKATAELADGSLLVLKAENGSFDMEQ